MFKAISLFSAPKRILSMYSANQKFMLTALAAGLTEEEANEILDKSFRDASHDPHAMPFEIAHDRVRGILRNGDQ
ncbi:MAG: hypothetical protein ABJN40_13085 [Sneathiella sp.]